MIRTLLLLMLLLPGVTAAENRMLWRATSTAGTAYLLGSIHFGKADMYPLAPAITEAFAKADALVVEANILEANLGKMALLLAEKGMYSGSDTLRSQLKSSTWQALSDALRGYGMSTDLFERQRPWLVSMTLTKLALQRAGYSELHGVDLYFLNQAKGQKPIIELESLSEQIDLFTRFSAAEQEEFLLTTLREQEQGAAMLEALKNAWSTGDDKAMNTLMNDSLQANPQLKRVYQILLTDRNIQMASTIAELLRQPKTYFVVLGAGHLVGPDSVAEHLRKAGHRVERW